jgi:Fe(3+) dicitrate transport protein
MLGLAIIALSTTALSPIDQPPANTVAPVGVVARRQDDTQAKLDHIMREVSGAQITVTKRTTITKLDQQPTVIANDLQQLFSRSPGLVVSEQPTPAQFNLSYRGLGNPQEAEYVTVLQDGVPLASDWIGFPTLYVMPLPQGNSEVQLIRGGSALLYGPEPAPAVNFIAKRATKGEPLTGYTEDVVGSQGLFSSYNVLENGQGPIEYRASFGHVARDGGRQNAKSTQDQGDLRLGWRPSDKQLVTLDLEGYRVTAGDPGRLTWPQFLGDQKVSPTPYNHNWVERLSAVLGYSAELDGNWLLDAKAWVSRQELDSRAAAALSPAGVPPTSTTVQDDLFRTAGVDVRARKRWGRGNAFTIGVVGYGSDAPFRQWTNAATLTPGHDDHSGTPRLDQDRSSTYTAIFAENVFRLPGRFHVVPSFRLDHERVKVDETVRPPTLTRPLIHVDASRTEPLLGLGIGNDFGKGNETYLNISQGWRPLRYFDVASPFSNLNADQPADPSKALSIEAGVHGTPVKGLFYDVGVFQIDFKNRIETQRNYNPLDPTAVRSVNTGDTRHRGLEAEASYDFLASTASDHLVVFASGSWLSAKFTDSLDPTQIGKTPAFAPNATLKGGLTWRRDKAYAVSLNGIHISSQYWQDSNLPGAAANPIPALIPSYTLFNLSGDYWVNRRLRILGGVSNLTDKHYYNRVFSSGIEPGLRRTAYIGLAVGF